MIKSKTTYSILSVVIALFFGTSLTLAWTNPSAIPPNGNGAINVISGAPASTLYIASGGNLGIGTNNPGLKLEVVGSGNGLPVTSGITQTNGALRIGNAGTNGILDIGINGGSGAWLQYTSRIDLSATYPLLLNPNGGNVGIGKNNPNSAYALDVNGTINATAFAGGASTGTIGASNVSSGTFGSATSGGNYSFPANLGVGAGGTGILTVTGGDIVVNTSSTQGYPDITLQGSDIPGVTLKNDGNRLWATTATTGSMKFNISDAYSNDRGVSFYYVPGTTGAVGGELRIGQQDKNSATYTHGITSFYTNGLERMRINSSGSVGVGTAGPITSTFDVSQALSTPVKLDLSGGSYHVTGSGGLYIGDESTANAGGAHIRYDQTLNNIYIDGIKQGVSAPNTVFRGGNVGIGTISPYAKLGVTHSSSSTALASEGLQYALYYTNNNATTNNWSDIAFADNENGAITALLGVQYSDRTNHYGNMVMATRGTDGFNERVRVAASGSVGIGTPSPLGLLHVNGGQMLFQKAGAYSATGLSNVGVLTYDTMAGDLVLNALSTGGNTNIHLYTSNAGVNAERVKIDNAGFVTFNGNTNLCSLVTYGTGGLTSCPAGYYTWGGLANSGGGSMLCCKVSNPI